MILSFSLKDKNGQPTHFVEKIWNCLGITIWQPGNKVVNDLITIDISVTGAKKHTFREDKNNRWHVGSLIHFVVFNRTPRRLQFAPVMRCKGVQKIIINRTSDYLNETEVYVDGRLLNKKEVQQLAWNDGFDNLIDFWMWFSEGFEGKIIHWTDLMY
jgi:hypothetical protein